MRQRRQRLIKTLIRTARNLHTLHGDHVAVVVVPSDDYCHEPTHVYTSDRMRAIGQSQAGIQALQHCLADIQDAKGCSDDDDDDDNKATVTDDDDDNDG